MRREGIDFFSPLKRGRKSRSWFVPVLFSFCSPFPVCSFPDKENRSSTLRLKEKGKMRLRHAEKREQL